MDALSLVQAGFRRGKCSENVPSSVHHLNLDFRFFPPFLFNCVTLSLLKLNCLLEMEFSKYLSYGTKIQSGHVGAPAYGD